MTRYTKLSTMVARPRFADHSGIDIADAAGASPAAEWRRWR
jgi:hypothetical protein